MLAVHGQKFFAGFVHSGHDQFPGRNEDFLVGKRDAFAEFYGFVGSCKADDTDGSGDYDVRTGVSAHREHAFRTVMDFWELGNALLAQPCRERIRVLGLSHRDDLRLVPFDLSDEFIEIVACGKRHHAKARGERVHHRKALAANRACRTKDGKLLHETKNPL